METSLAIDTFASLFFDVELVERISSGRDETRTWLRMRTGRGPIVVGERDDRVQRGLQTGQLLAVG